MIICKSSDEIKIMKRAACVVAEVLSKIEDILKPGLTTECLDRVAEEIIKKRKGVPAFKGYKGRISNIPFPGTICASINEEVVHGIPSSKKLKEGDLISVDVGVMIKGYYGDAARSFLVGDVQDDVQRLWQATKEALDLGIEKCIPGGRLSDISSSIEKRAAGEGFSVVKDFVGHGIGKSMHEDPQILNYGPPGRGPRLKAGMVFAIEPMLNMGSSEVKVLDDEWTVVTEDNSVSCHFEDTVAITIDGPVVLSRDC